MAERTGSKKSLDEIRQEIAHSRDRLARDLSGLRYEFDLPLKFKKSFQRSTGAWVAGAALVGLLFTLRPAKKKIIVGANSGREKRKGLLEAGFLVGALKLVGTMLRPAITSYLTSRLAGRAAGRR